MFCARPLALAAVTAVLAPAAVTVAQETCDAGVPGRRPEEVTPASGARGVTLDAPIVVRYSPGFFGPDGPGGSPEMWIQVGRCVPSTCAAVCTLDEAEPVAGTVQVLGDRLFFLPEGGLAPGTTYVGLATGIEGLIDFSFCTGALRDATPPTAPQIRSIQPAETRPACPPGGFKIDVTLEPSLDDGPAGSIEYLLYLTRGRRVAAPELRDRYRHFAADALTLHLILDPDEAAEPVCVRVFAIDGVGRLSEVSSERCVDPLTSAAFQPLCAASPAGGRRHAPLALALAAGALLAIRRRLAALQAGAAEADPGRASADGQP